MDFDTILGIALVVLGVGALVGEISFAFLLPAAGIALVVLGVLILGNVLSASNLTGIILVILGFLLNSGRLGVPGQVSGAINFIAGIVLLVLGLREIA
jgi:ABC-type enterochelin transport system permease subunit